ncbi:alpha-1,3-galactosidase-related protein [Cohnella nanjingensis]|uniref:alpha-1,3-galactosidase-related protein n=1 Tax=Cohnella nanjingensis TaxID=1387779 RepID=UPI00406BA045
MWVRSSIDNSGRFILTIQFEVVVRFMHPQTFGFAAFGEGDEIAFIRAAALKRSSPAAG